MLGQQASVQQRWLVVVQQMGHSLALLPIQVLAHYWVMQLQLLAEEVVKTVVVVMVLALDYLE